MRGDDLFSVAGKVACVTGASGGLGQAAASLLARSGAKVVGIARRREALAAWQSRTGGETAIVAAGLSDRGRPPKGGDIIVAVDGTEVLQPQGLADQRVDRYQLVVQTEGVLRRCAQLDRHFAEGAASEFEHRVVNDDLDRCLEQIEEYKEMGFTDVIIRLFYPEMSQAVALEHIGLVGEEVIPEMHRL